MQFNIGDRVYYNRGNGGRYEGTVVTINPFATISVVFDCRVPDGHACGGICAEGYGLMFRRDSTLLSLAPASTEINNFGDFIRAQDKRIQTEVSEKEEHVRRSQTEVSEQEERVRQRIACDELGYPACEALYTSTAEWERDHGGRSWSEHVAEVQP